MQVRVTTAVSLVEDSELYDVFALLLQEILADAVDRLCTPEKRGSIIRNSANVVSFEETKDTATGGAHALHG
jgi:hypothetical protein